MQSKVINLYKENWGKTFWICYITLHLYKNHQVSCERFSTTKRFYIVAPATLLVLSQSDFYVSVELMAKLIKGIKPKRKQVNLKNNWGKCKY